MVRRVVEYKGVIIQKTVILHSHLRKNSDDRHYEQQVPLKRRLTSTGRYGATTEKIWARGEEEKRSPLGGTEENQAKSAQSTSRNIRLCSPV